MSCVKFFFEMFELQGPGCQDKLFGEGGGRGPWGDRVVRYIALFGWVSLFCMLREFENALLY